MHLCPVCECCGYACRGSGMVGCARCNSVFDRETIERNTAFGLRVIVQSDCEVQASVDEPPEVETELERIGTTENDPKERCESDTSDDGSVCKQQGSGDIMQLLREHWRRRDLKRSRLAEERRHEEIRQEFVYESFAPHPLESAGWMLPSLSFGGGKKILSEKVVSDLPRRIYKDRKWHPGFVRVIADGAQIKMMPKKPIDDEEFDIVDE